MLRPRRLPAMLLPALLSTTAVPAAAAVDPPACEVSAAACLDEWTWQGIVILPGGESDLLALVRISPAGIDRDGTALFAVRVLQVLGAEEGSR